MHLLAITGRCRYLARLEKFEVWTGDIGDIDSRRRLQVVKDAEGCAAAEKTKPQ
jgi:hypothetical protein